MKRVLIAFLLLLTACAAIPETTGPAVECKWPEIPSDGECCRDLNENGVCDIVDYAPEIEAQKQQEYEEAAEKARETAEKSGKYKPTIVNELHANASKVANYRFLYDGDEIIVANGSLTRRLFQDHPLGDREIDGRRMKVVVNTVLLDIMSKNATAECIPPQHLLKLERGTQCDEVIGRQFEVSYDEFKLRLPIEWLEDLLYRTPFDALPGTDIGRRKTMLYRFTALNDARRITNIWVDAQTSVPLRVEIWQGDNFIKEEVYSDFYPI